MSMKMILKLFALPVFILIKVLYFVANLITNISSYAIVLLLFVIVGCGIYCIVQNKWMELAILVGMGVATFLVLFVLVWIVVKAENWSNRLGEFIRS